MKLWVGVTDNDWYRFLSQLPNVDEINFWQPGGKELANDCRNKADPMEEQAYAR